MVSFGVVKVLVLADVLADVFVDVLADVLGDMIVVVSKSSIVSLILDFDPFAVANPIVPF